MFTSLQLVKRNDRLVFCIKEGEEGETVYEESKEFLRKHLIEYFEWKQYKLMLSFSRERYSKRLDPTISAIVKSCLDHNDVPQAISFLNSAQYVNCCPPSELVKRLIQTCFYSSTSSLEKTNKVIRKISEVERSLAIQYINSHLRSGSWDTLLMEEIIIGNIFEQASEEEKEGSLFWEFLQSFLDLIRVELHPQAWSLIHTIINRLFITRKLFHVVKMSFEERKLRRRYISSHFIKLYIISAGMPHSSLISSCLALITLSLASDHTFFYDFIEEIYEAIPLLGADFIKFITSSMIPAFQLELSLLILERKYHLGKVIPLGRRMLLVRRITNILSSLQNYKVETRSGVSKCVDSNVFQLVQLVTSSFCVVFRDEVEVCRSRSSKEITFLLSEDEIEGVGELLDEIICSNNWPSNISFLLTSSASLLKQTLSND